jgi:DNA-binding response OmpR family regulator
MASKESRRILVIEDEEDVAGLLRARLASHGYEVHVESLGQTGIQAAEALHPDLVILDLMLPDMDGFTVSETLRKRHASWVLPILMLTARDQPLDKLHGYGAGADAYLTKPYEAGELLVTVAGLLGDVPA